MNNDANEVLAAWETSSQYWNKHQPVIEKMFAPLSRALIEAAQIGPGQKILDVGGGSGEPSFTLAGVVGEKGLISYTDPAAGMVRSAQAEAARRGIKNISFQQAPVEKLPFADGSFDGVVGRLSAMFFPDPLTGLRETLRVLKAGGHVSMLVWAEREFNPFFSVVSEILDRFITPEPEDDDAPGAFRYAAPGKLAGLMREAGAIDVTERELTFAIEAPLTVDQFWELRTEMSDSFRKKLARLVPDQVDAIRYTVQKGVGAYFKRGEMNFPGKVLIVSGRK